MATTDSSTDYFLGWFILKILMALKAVFVPPVLPVQVFKYPAYYMYLPHLHFK